MSIERVGKRGVLFSFDDPYKVNSYVIIGDESIFVCDTGCGPEHMNVLKGHLESLGLRDRRMIIFNTHADYDHYWGNGSFDVSMIVGHRYCRERIINEADSDLTSYKSHQRGAVKIAPPTVVFDKRLFFVEEEIEFFYTPGHTRDSASLFDYKDRVLVVGDNVESPIPFINEYNLREYIASLDDYLSRDWDFLVSGHDPVQSDAKLVRENREYILSVIDTVKTEPPSTRWLQVHVQNLRTLLKSYTLSSDIKDRYSAFLEYYESLL